MANTKSAKKAVRKLERQTVRNRARRTHMRSQIRKVEEALEAQDKAAAESAMKLAEPLIARGSQKGLVHKNTAARKISRLTARIKSLDAAS